MCFSFVSYFDICILYKMFNLLIIYVFMLYRGSAIAQTIGYFVMFSLTLLYILVSGVYKSTWKGWHNHTLLKYF